MSPDNPKAGPGAVTISLRWIARVWSVASLGLILLFFIGEGVDPARVAPREWVGLLFFPTGVVAGMIVAWRREGLGSSIALGSLLAFYGVYGLLLTRRLPHGWAFIVFSAPAVLFLACWLLSRGARNATT